MKPWLDDLSEEWVPQPTTSADVQDADNPSATQVLQSEPPKLKSRLPRMRLSSGSLSEIQLRRRALAERSQSDNNLTFALPSDAPDHADSRSASRSFSVASLGSSIAYGTVEQKPKTAAPAKAEHNTPEWRRRLIKGDVGYGDQKDLFSPMGLENIFQKPNGATSEDAPKETRSRLGLFKNLSAMPSSPPPWPSSDQLRNRAFGDGGDENTEESQSALEGSVINHGQDQQNHIDESLASNPPGSCNSQQAPRTVSGQIEFENENFSPVYLSTNLKIGTSAPPIPSFKESDLASRLQQLQSPPPSDSLEPASEDASVGPNRGESSFARLQDDTLPIDLPTGTPDITGVGGFVEIRRGGYSRDGSFRRRPLSPSAQSKTSRVDGFLDSSAGPENSEGQSGSNSDLPTIDLPPTTPRRREAATHLSPERAHLSASPLKLFDAHDTFTSNRLQRRLSQLDYKLEKASSSTEKHNKTESTKVVHTTRLTSVEEVSMRKLTDIETKISPEVQQPSRAGSFGQGHLDTYQFPEDLSVLSSQGSASNESAPEDSPTSDVAPPGSRPPLRFQYDDGSPDTRQPSRTKRQGLTRVSNPFSMSQSKTNVDQGPSPTPAELEQQEYPDGKRGPTSPFKNPTPKRRRTLYSVEDDDDDVFSDSGFKPAQDSHIAMQTIIGRKRKDARHDHSINVADPDVIARRHILRPRNPTPSQRRKEEIHAEIIEATEAFLQSSPKLRTIREQLNSPGGFGAPSEESKAAAVASEVAAFTLKRTQAMREETRKRSVTTQDFLDEAVKIMDYIRAKGRPTSGLGSLEESDSELAFKPDADDLPSTPYTFERPPSREGRVSAWREPNKRDLDPQVISHLRKFQEQESDHFLGSSMNSLRFSRIRGQASPEGKSIVVEQDDIRITDNQSRHTPTTSNEDGPNSNPMSHHTHPSTGSSTAQTMATSASRRSEHVATLAPEAVAHLIPEQIAGMSFDREKNMWVKQKSPSKEHRPSEDISTNESEDDPFGNIPDLTVDETAELLQHNGSPTRPQATAETMIEETEEFEMDEQARPSTREGKGIPIADTSSVPSKASNFAWSFPKTETRATSWSDQETRHGGTYKMQQTPATYSIPESDENDVEHEIKYFEGRGIAQPVLHAGKVRDITISISTHDPLPKVTEDGIAQENEDSRRPNSPRKIAQRNWEFSNTRTRPKKGVLRHMTGTKTLPNARVPPIGEVDGELSILHESPPKNYRMQLSMSVSAPVFNPESALAAPSSPVKGDVTFMLSDLPEFTLNQIDECEVPDRVVVKHDGTKFSQALEDRYAQGTAELVKALQDAEPDEPYWEDLREVNLHKKRLTNVHRLDEFCYRLQDLDVSDNELHQVKGIPFTVRRLQAQNNCLTGLTTWANLINLQYLDISGNDIDSLDGLDQLIHLRTLKVDNNKIRSLDGVMNLDGLLELSVVGNQIESVDFEGAELKSLHELNLSGNRLLEVRNLHQLPQLQHLNLDDNCIEELPLSDDSRGRCSLLRSLQLCRNGMMVLEVDQYFPNLESLYVDGNSLTNVSGLEHLRHLRTFSAREQLLESDSDTETCVSNLVRNADIRNLYLSVNPTRTLELPQHLLNLQRLELASMGLKELPDNFGQLTSNIRSINLNFNSIKDLRPLLNIKRLTELLVAGNRISRLRTNLAVLSKLTTLTKLDMRENPLTLRFYPPTSENRIMSLRQRPQQDDTVDRFILPDGDEDADRHYILRLDDETRLRRRVHEMMLATSCANLQELDGLTFDKARVLVKDDIWQRLLVLGVIRRSEKTAGNRD
ncbi:hypothetical protein P154DRAFT_460943 [Amniculicola lignicola CBS 123094]|uniref:L domain-like protein n=1 Tax=Amniculicola lignicola CBS 123094 TaxID=1392246 RepID=A0A6A5WR13_9PLEO|nr:hypothetical protein P154DRAFT_460943 [Amniculicola lignicola CBS 123094]